MTNNAWKSLSLKGCWLLPLFVFVSLFWRLHDFISKIKQPANIYLSWPPIRSITHVYTTDILDQKTCFSVAQKDVILTSFSHKWDSSMLDVWSQENSTLVPTHGHLTLLIFGLSFKSIHVIFGFKKEKKTHHYLMAAHFSISYIWIPSP